MNQMLYCVFSGSYKDRYLDAVFSTSKKAEKYIQFRQQFNLYDEVDNTPTIRELDFFTIPEYVYVSENREDGTIMINDPNLIFEEGIDAYEIIVKVKYNEDTEIMLESAKEKINMLKAKELGI